MARPRGYRALILPLVKPSRIYRGADPYMPPLCNNGVTQMSDFAPRPVTTSYDFDIKHERHGPWTAQDRGGLAGGTFRTRKAAMRFALTETGGDAR